MVEFLRQRPGLLPIAALLLLIAAYFGNLGARPLWADEGTRAVVALEMLLSGNYWVPTINGELYFNKPPFYNWIILWLFKLTGSWNEWMVRLPSVVPLVLFGFTIYWWTKKHLGKATAFLAAAMFVTCGRMLIYSSMLGHIDIFYSWVTFLSFMAIFYFQQKEKWLLLFVVSYFLSAIAFLCKGLPTVLFQGFTVIGWLVVTKNWKKLLSWQHLLGIVVFLVPVGGYFLKYNQYHDAMDWAAVLWDQSAQRTVVDKAWYESILHVFVFPLEQVMHLAPWSILAVFLFRRRLYQEIRERPLLFFCAVTVLVNIPVYWLSPDVLPRYLFMLYPLLFMVIAWGYFHFRSDWPKVTKVVELVLGMALVLSILGPLGVLFTDLDITFLWLKIGLVMVGLGLLAFLYFKLPEQKMVVLTLGLLMVRVGFNFFVLEDRIQNSDEPMRKAMATKVGQTAKGNNTVTWSGLNHESIFYIERETEQVLHRAKELSQNRLYIVYEAELDLSKAKKLDSLQIRHENRMLYLVQF